MKINISAYKLMVITDTKNIEVSLSKPKPKNSLYGKECNYCFFQKIVKKIMYDDEFSKYIRFITFFHYYLPY